MCWIENQRAIIAIELDILHNTICVCVWLIIADDCSMRTISNINSREEEKSVPIRNVQASLFVLIFFNHSTKITRKPISITECTCVNALADVRWTLIHRINRMCLCIEDIR